MRSRPRPSVSPTHRLPSRRTRRPSFSSWKENSKRSTHSTYKRKPSSKSASRPSSTRRRFCNPAMASLGGPPSSPPSRRVSSSLQTT
ncbi:hypothetical protein VTI74DRAFT_11278 [Chaetomium olivicolor]